MKKRRQMTDIEKSDSQSRAIYRTFRSQLRAFKLNNAIPPSFIHSLQPKSKEMNRIKKHALAIHNIPWLSSAETADSSNKHHRNQAKKPTRK
jgi:hypothetical protein